MPKKTRTMPNRHASRQERADTSKGRRRWTSTDDRRDGGSAPSPAARVQPATERRQGLCRLRPQGTKDQGSGACITLGAPARSPPLPLQTSRAPHDRRALRRQVRDQGAGQRRRRRPRARGRTPLRAPPASPASPAKSDPRTAAGGGTPPTPPQQQSRITPSYLDDDEEEDMEMEPYKHTLNVPYLVVCRCAGSRPSTWSLVRPVRPSTDPPTALRARNAPCRSKVKIHNVTLGRKRSIGPFPQNSGVRH